MAIAWRYTPPTVNAPLLVHAAAITAARQGAEQLLAASQPLVPVDTGDLKDSGHVEQDGLSARVVYDVLSPEGYPYGIRQHEDLELHHPHGGQAKFLEQPLHTEAPAIAVTMAETIRKALM